MEAAAAVDAPSKARLLILDISDPRHGLVLGCFFRSADNQPYFARLWL
jgi:hypothetical protein